MGRSGTIIDGASGFDPGAEDLPVETAAKPDLLIVDDDPLITDTLDYVLGRDFNVRVAESRAQARSVLRQLDDPPELALVDLGLPPTPHRPDEGFQLINELLALSPATRTTPGTRERWAPSTSSPSRASPTGSSACFWMRAASPPPSAAPPPRTPASSAPVWRSPSCASRSVSTRPRRFQS
jgi:hypothetical protein